MTIETKTLIAAVELGEAGLAGLRLITDKLNRRAERLGLDKVVVTVGAEKTVRNEDTGYDEKRYDVEIEGCAPCINGWYLAARIENNEIVGAVTKIAPGKFADCDYSEYRDHDFGCDHCSTRRRRNDVFVLADDNGNRKVVGRNCLADFLRTTDASGFAEYAKWLDVLHGISSADCEDEAYGDGWGGRGGNASFDLTTFCAVARGCTVKLGWTSRTNAREDEGRSATADDALYVLCGRGEDHARFIRVHNLEGCADYTEYAAKAVAWAQSLSDEQTAKSEYLYTIRKIALAGRTDYSLAGYAASIGPAMERDIARNAENAERAANAKTKVHIGCTGERLRDQLVTVVRVRYCEGHYGVSTIVAMEANLPDGTVAPITWFASGSKEFDEGADYMLTGTVKSHDDDNRYGRQTKVNRCKLVEA